ncbi:phosphotransferase enzyme family protein [Pedobacter boryungensis]|uniref:Aminoglycoside phosphotransferase family protein n=1 Tax=Pedobacter boryungensis TaxID=869962 RepID=A0ABX2D9H6_9SPHI|nr:aminoglycoside phosphotransferase family protein [Pedobacter boryungensis]NQX30502.1 aminoglycoside phosphotransferase family protein [Pedobacter boryungensis]
MFQEILASYGLQFDDYKIELHGSGLINYTWKVSGVENDYLLQKINTTVFKDPIHIDENLVELRKFLDKYSPDYLFVSPLPNLKNETMVVVNEEYYRIFPFIKNSKSADYVKYADEAYQASRQFGQFAKELDGFDTRKLKYTLADFHNLSLRVEQFKSALKNASIDRLQQATAEIEELTHLDYIAIKYQELIQNGKLKERVVHHDTKINNVLLHDETGEGICVIDLDTVMPGYYISDVGDMMRTYLSEANEEEKELTKVFVREEMFFAIYRGYMEEMGEVLSISEKEQFIFSGKFMIYMQALRFLTDFLNDDIYYHTTYSEHNLVRAKNQVQLLKSYLASEYIFEKIFQENSLVK